MNKYITRFKRSLLFMVLAVSFVLLGACGVSKSEEAMNMYKTADSYTMSMSINFEKYTLESEYKVDGAKRYFAFDGTEEYEHDDDESSYRYSKNIVSRWERTKINKEDNAFIPNNSVVLNPEDLEADMFEESDSTSTLTMKKESYESVFGEKAPTILSFSLIKHENHLEINYAFNQNKKTVPVNVTIDSIGTTNVELPI